MTFYQNLSWGKRAVLKGVLCFSNLVSLGARISRGIKALQYLTRSKRERNSLLPGPTDFASVSTAHFSDNKSRNHDVCQLHTYNPDYRALGMAKRRHVPHLRSWIQNAVHQNYHHARGIVFADRDDVAGVSDSIRQRESN